MEGTWLRIDYELLEDNRFEANNAMLNAYLILRGMYDESDGNTQVFYMQNAVATFESFGVVSEAIEF